MITQIKKIVHSLGNKQFKKAGHDEFISWLSFANAGMLNEGNIYCFEYAVENLPSENPVIEIGSFCGLSTNLINFYLDKNQRKNKMITCDRWMFEGAEKADNLLGGSRISHSKYREFVKQSYIRNIQFFSESNLPFTVEKFSDDFFDAWKLGADEKDILGRPVHLGGSISFAYIDGNHTYDFAMRDFRNVDAFLEPGGFILFDDSADDSQWEVNQVVKEILKEGKYELVIKNPNYLLRKSI